MVVNGELGILKSSEDYGNIIPELDNVFRKFPQSEPGKDILSMLKRNPKVIDFFDKSAELELSEDLDDYACWYAWFSNEYGEQEVKRALENFLCTEAYEQYLTMWVTGLEVDNEISLNNNIRIVEIEKIPVSYTRWNLRYATRSFNI